MDLFERYHIEDQIQKALDRKVWLPSGGHLIIDPTEALTVIDVNTGKFVGKNSLEETVYENNLEAAEEIARQLRLRDIGGIIVIDFIDMGNSKNRAALFNHLREEMKDDKAKHKILPPSKFGLVQITRQRVRPERNIKTKEQNPSVTSSGEVEAPIVLVQKITNELERLINKGHKNIVLNTHPFIAAFLTQGFLSIRSKWFFEHKKWVNIIPRDAYTYLEYHFENQNGVEIK